MGSRPIQLLTHFPIPISQNWNYHRGFANYNFTGGRARWWQCFCGGRSGGSRWERGKKANPNRGFRFNDAYVTNDYDEEDGFGFRNAAKQRVWWSEDEEEDEGFGILEASIWFNWVFKVFRAFGWMIPTVVISLTMGTGPNGIVMALALPLAQSALSLAAETLLGRADEAPRPRKRPNKKRPFAGARRRTRVRNEKEIRSQTRKKSENNYKSWLVGNNVSSTKEVNWQDFGGWDELDRQVRSDQEPQEPRTTSAEQRDDEPRAEERLKISRRTKGDSQFFMRFLIAMFPFLGFWTKLF